MELSPRLGRLSLGLAGLAGCMEFLWIPALRVEKELLPAVGPGQRLVGLRSLLGSGRLLLRKFWIDDLVSFGLLAVILLPSAVMSGR